MFLDFFHLREEPFGDAPDPAYLYASRTHCEVLDSLADGLLDGQGFLVLIANPGLGKTTLLGQVREGLQDRARCLHLPETRCSSREFLQYLLSQLGVDSTGMGLVAMHIRLHEMLCGEMLAGKRFVLMVDEAQNLDDTVLETIRLLSHFETSNTKLLQIVLAGQPQLGERLRQMAQLFERITAVKHLEALSPEETAGYVRHRLKVAGPDGGVLFESDALKLVYKKSQGIPRDINKICYRALLEAYAEGRHAVSRDIVDKADRKLAAPTASRPRLLPGRLAVARRVRSGRIRRRPALTYTPRPDRGVMGWQRSMGALAIFLLSVGLVLPRDRMKGLFEAVPNVTATESSAPLKGIGDSRQTLNRDELPGRSRVVQPRVDEPAPQKMAAVRAWSAEKAAVQEDATRKTSSDRTHFDSYQTQVTSFFRGPAAEAKADQANPPSLTRELGLKIYRITIDPGHGGYDPGTVGPHGLSEKELCLDVALRLGQLIKENIADAEVVYTRTDDRHVSLEARTEIANNANADMFISIHANSSNIREARGAETYYLSLTASQRSNELATRENALAQFSVHELPELVKKITSNDKIMESKLLAAHIQTALSERLRFVSQPATNRGVKQAPFIVLTGAQMPAVLSEISFVSNTTDEKLLLQSSERQRVAEGLYRGISAYLDSLQSLPQKEQRLVSENHPTASGFGTSAGPARVRLMPKSADNY